ncbi:hypothetical protein [Pelomonas cellulosilytica]|uniref:DUF1579 domain-containing protein n=1 Tax=Pelomonas cellulosilytica TaxID=2906762 RepID=A0ABS8XZS2_9BURK|nr:hypothetical protein [Pelomonas sp. P8]MCE4558094.1 hypothetical protein [Pelomonas sp. P8]
MQRRTLLQRAVLAATAAAAPAGAWALYDPKPSALLAWAPGAWRGTLTYRDYSNPDRKVTLPCRLSIALTAPEELALFYVFDDGPGKTVYSYERMAFDFAVNRLNWTSGIAKPGTSQYAVTRATTDAEATQLQFERAADGHTEQYRFDIRQTTLSLGKTEVAPTGEPTLRNAFELRRVGE